MNGVIELLGLDKAIAGALGQFGEAGGLAVKIALLAWLAWASSRSPARSSRP
jgi:hypothetical protein